MIKVMLVRGKLRAIGYLIEHTEYNDEWSGAGMYEAVAEVYKSKVTTFSKEYLDRLLTLARER